MAEPTWTPKMVEARVEEAADTLRRLPEERMRTARSAWPPVIRDFWEMYGVEPARLRLGPPSAAAIDRMDQALEWLRWLEADDARIVWLRACDVRWKAICWRLGADRPSLWRRWVAALALIAARLNRGPSTPVRRGTRHAAQQQPPLTG